MPEPNTWRDLLVQLDLKLAVAGKRVAVQEYGAHNEELVSGLRQRGAHVTPVPIYGWTLPDDTGPLRAAARRVVAGEADIALFTSSIQITNLFHVAGEMGLADMLRDVLCGRTIVASIGPITTQTLQAHGIRPDVQADHPKMGHLMAAVARGSGELLQRKRTIR